MAWNEVNVFEQRCHFVLLASRPGANKSSICREFGISRPTGDKWLRRYEEGGLEALHNESRRPKRYKDPTPGYVRDEIYRLRNEHGGWGGRTIRAELVRSGYGADTPCARTIDRLLKRAGFVKPSKRKRRVDLPAAEIVQPKRVNDVWTVDFKGWWRMRDGRRCEPLTLRDEYSKYVLSISVQWGTSTEGVKKAFQQAFKRYGLPLYIRSDNGAPFACTRAVCGLSSLSVWWMKHGITPNRMDVASPHQNGAHERFHRDIKRDLQQNPAANIAAEQRRFDRWRRFFNNERPHQSLGMKTPAECYSRSQRRYSSKVLSHVYPVGMDYRKVDANGAFCWRGKPHFVSKALTGEFLGLDNADGITQVWYREHLLGIVSPSKRRILEVKNPLRGVDLQ